MRVSAIPIKKSVQ